MALVVYDRVQETTATTGTGTITLAGAVAGYQSFSVVGNGNTTYYCIVNGNNWEVGIGTYTSSGTTLARTTVLSNSSGTTSAISLSGTSNVFVTYPSEKSVNLDGSGNVSALGTISSGTWNGSTISSTYLPTVTLGSTAVTLGTTVATFAGVTLSSPTFTTPVLGTPSSGTLTSCTGLPNAGLVNSSVTLGSTAVSLGTTVATFAGITLSSPTFVTPALGTPSSGTLTSCSGYNSNSLSGVTLASTVITSSLTTVGTIGTGTWQGTAVGVGYGGTGSTTLTANNVLLGNGTSALQAVAPGTSGNVLTSNGTTWTSGTPAAGAPTGSILMWSTTTAPTGYLICNGSAVSRTTYATLFGVVSTTFGTGDGTTTFNLPNYNDKMAIGAGGSYALAATGGSSSTTLATTNLPSHNHTATPSLTGTPSLSASSSVTDPGHYHYMFNGDTSDPNLSGGAQYVAYNSGNAYYAYTMQGYAGAPAPYLGITEQKTTGVTVSTSISGSVTIGGSIAIGNTGSGTAITTISPYLGIYFIIKT